MRRRASSTALPSLAPMVTVPTTPSSSTAMSAPVSCCSVLMTLPLGPMTSPILSIGISMETIFGALLATSVARLGDGAGHDAEDGEPGLLGLQQRLGQHVGRQAVDLRVELQRGHRVGRARPP